MATGKLNLEVHKEKPEEKKPAGFNDKIVSKTMQKMYRNKNQFDNSKNTRRGA